MQVTIYGRTLAFNNPSWETKARWGGRLSPEPETVAWIEGMRQGEVFFDIGANIGRFSAMAACRGLQVFAFEPQAAQYAELCAMALGNGLEISAYCAALSDDFRLGKLPAGRSAATFALAEDVIGRFQSAMAWPLDGFVSRLGIWPDHIKIDVDGNEPEIIAGGAAAIRQAKSVLIEIDPGAKGHGNIVGIMDDLGFTFDPAQVEACRERDGKFAGMANHIFRKLP